MTRKEQAKMRRLELENEALKKQIDRHMDIYRDQLYEIVEAKTKLELIQEAMEYGK